jgi:Protein of unknown function (DUF2470)
VIVVTRCRPPVPTHAERGRAIALRGGQAALVGTAVSSDASPPSRPLVHHVWADGSAALLLPDADPLLRHVGDDGCAVMLEIADPAPVALREPVRALLWITGVLAHPADARRLAAAVADVRPDPALLDLGHGATLVRLQPGSVVVSDGDGTAALRPAVLAAARPDPFCLTESRWLAHLEEVHPEVLGALARWLPPALRDGRVRPLGADRFGLRLRVENGRDDDVHTGDRGDSGGGGEDRGGGDHDVRLAWEREARTPGDLRAGLAALARGPLRSTRAASAPRAPGA